ncbi:MAG TPA: aromatic ring-hydroxylating dioxygenase subunit alpha [Gemmatimonadaceae bacterium]|nr:aromatic ring-hydroxylating dioxygenase subunit alpha [Gemmatimonadaceae bacterium]
MATFHRTTDIPTAGARALPRRYYASPELFGEEMEKIFARRWLCAGREHRVSAPGDFVVVEAAGESIIITRDPSGTLRAFYNVCRHRGSRLCETSHGNFPGHIQCPYHAWTYALDGHLLGAPSSDAIDDFDRDDWPLHALSVASWEGFLFICLDDAPVPFHEAFAPLIGRFARWGLPSLGVGRTIEYDVAANWKLILQNYSECYHCAPVHPALARLTPPTSGENDLVDGPFLGGFMMLNAGSESLTMSGRACGVPVGDLPAEDHRRVYYYSIFPNLLLSLHPDYVMAHTLWPLSAGRTRIVCEWLFHPDSLADARWNPDDAVAFWERTNREDWHICEQSQLGVMSRKYVPGPYSRRESLSAAVDREVLRALGV